MSSTASPDMRLTVQQVAQALGLSSTTVSRALSGKGRISEATRARVFAYVGQNGGAGVPSRRLQERATHNLAFVAPAQFVQLDLPFLRKCMGGACYMAAQRGYDLLLCYADADDLAPLERQLREHKVDGVIFSRALENDPCRELVLHYRVPYVVVGHLKDETALQVDNDQAEAARELTRLLLQMGTRRIAYVGGSTRYTVNQDRLQGYMRALTEYDITPDHGLICTTADDRAQIGDIVEMLLEQYPECILCDDDAVALSVLSCLQNQGIQVPAQLRLASLYDSELLRNSSPTVTAIQFDAVRLGSAACRLLLDKLAGKDVVPRQVQNYQVVLRESTK